MLLLQGGDLIGFADGQLSNNFGSEYTLVAFVFGGFRNSNLSPVQSGGESKTKPDEASSLFRSRLRQKPNEEAFSLRQLACQKVVLLAFRIANRYN